MRTLIIGFSGRARHGKTICCDAIQAQATSECYISRIYDIGSAIRRLAIETGRLPQVERENMTREQLQVLVDLGKEMRTYDANYWVKNVLAQVETDKPNVALCPNLRLPMEAQSFRDVGGFVVRCQRLNENDSLYISPDRDPNDITETALQFWPADFYLTTKPDQTELLEAQARTLYRYLQRRHINAGQ